MAKRNVAVTPPRHECELTTSPRARATADALATSVAGMFPAGLSQPALRALANAGYTRLEQLTRTTEREIAGLHGMGPKGIRLLREALAAKGKAFKNA